MGHVVPGPPSEDSLDRGCPGGAGAGWRVVLLSTRKMPPGINVLDGRLL